MQDDATRGRLRRALAPTRGKIVIALLATALGFGLYWWYDGGRWMFFPRHFGVVEDGLIYRSGRIHPGLIDEVLASHDIEVVVNLAARGRDNESRLVERDVTRRRGIRLVELDGLDGSGIGDLEDYVVAITEMARARKEQRPILVHCAAGTQRTGAAVGWFRMLFDGWSGAAAYDEYLSYRYHRPDSGRLERYMNGHVERLVERLVETGALEAPPATPPRFGPGN